MQKFPPPELQALIRKETHNTTQDLRKVIEKLQNEVTSLKSAKDIQQRGRGGASVQKLKQPSNLTSILKNPPHHKSPSKPSLIQTTKKGKQKEKSVGGNNKGTDNDKSKVNAKIGTKQSGRKTSKSPQRKRAKSPKSNRK